MPSVLAAPRVGSQVLGTLKYLCFIPDMSSELFRALTSTATPTCSAVAAVCDRPILLSSTCGIVMLLQCSGKRTAFAERRYRSCGTRARHAIFESPETARS